MWQLQYERLVGRGGIVGARAGDPRPDRSRTRASGTTFGRPIADHQVIAHKLADAATELEAARALLYSRRLAHPAGRVPRRRDLDGEEVRGAGANRLIDACLQVYGGAGYLAETPVSRAFRDARLWRIGGGTDEIMNEVIAKRLGIYG